LKNVHKIYIKKNKENIPQKVIALLKHERFPEKQKVCTKIKIIYPKLFEKRGKIILQ
jgi:hypothetical protein